MTTVPVLLNKVLRNHLTLATQLFLHELIALEWRELDLKDRYRAEYAPDISRLFALLEHMLAARYSFDGDESDPPYSDVVPRAGRTVPQMLECDHALVSGLQTVMQTGIAACEQVEDSVSANLLREALDTRARLIGWIEDKRRAAASTPADNRSLSVPSENTADHAAWAQINMLLTRTFALIDQTVCHTLVLTHAGKEAAALSTWRMSWQSMRDLGAIVSALAAKGWAIDTPNSAKAHASIKPIISANPDQTIERDRSLYALAAQDADKSVELTKVLGDADLERVLCALRDTLHDCAKAIVPAAAMSYSQLPQRTPKWTYTG